jgi:3-hydroxyisobutyrate dehydrogenase-like beta-hydroxyacid dehydrogenase
MPPSAVRHEASKEDALVPLPTAVAPSAQTARLRQHAVGGTGRRSAMQTIGFVGLGMMGGPMAANLAKAGFRVVGFDLRRQAVEALAAQGGSAARSLADLASCDAAIVMVNTDAQARAVIGELIEGGGPARILCMSTILPSTIRELGEQARAAGLGVLDAPVSGGPVVAKLGALAIMVGGDPALFEEARPLLGAMGGAIRHVGSLGAGLATKLVNNMIAITTFPVVLEALHVGVAQGLDVGTMIEVIRASTGNTWVTQSWDQARALLAFVESDPAQFESLAQTGLKDLELARTLCRESGLEAPFLSQAIATQEKHGVDAVLPHLVALARALRAGG